MILPIVLIGNVCAVIFASAVWMKSGSIWTAFVVYYGSGFAAFLLACVFVALCFDMRLRSPDGDCPNSFS